MTVTITTYDEAREAYRSPYLRQNLYDEGEVMMGDVLLNLHGEEHKQRRRLENRLFRREVFHSYQDVWFPRSSRTRSNPTWPRGGRSWSSCPTS